MVAAPDNAVLEGFLDEVANLLSDRHPELLGLFSVFADEAKFGRRWLAGNLTALPRQAHLLEVGGGLMLLSSALRREGFAVTVLEPIGTGFSAFSVLQKIVLDYADSSGCAPEVLSVKAEDLDVTEKYDFAFSVNVMEHVENIELAMRRVMVALNRGARYRFTCPNYLFPYEPHFSIPTFFSKRLTWILMKNRILNCKNAADPRGLWESLNWISMPQVARCAKSIQGCYVYFDTTLMSSTLERLATDRQFASRHSRWVHGIAKLLRSLGLSSVLRLIPSRFLPIIDCSLIRDNVEQRM